MQIKTVMQYQLTSVRVAITKIFIYFINIKSFRGYGERNHLNTLGQCKLLIHPLWKSVWSFHKNLKIGQPYDPAILLLGTYPEKVKILT